MSATYSLWPDREADLDVVIVGSGFSGLGMAIKLKQHGQHDFVILEKGDEIGGTWRDNRYPGCACDVPSHLYSYSFEPNPHWSRTYSTGQEIQAYLHHCAHKYAIDDHVWLNSPLQIALYDEATGVWTLTIGGPTARPRVIRCRALILGVGALHEPTLPDVPGLENFEGDLVHTAGWNPMLSLEHKNVGVIGTGASSIQVIPQIAPDVAELTIFQRTPPWILPKHDPEFSESAQDRFERRPRLARLYRSSIYWRNEARSIAFTTYPGMLKAAQLVARKHIRSQVSNPELREQLTPDYTMGCKRVLASSDYYPTFTRDNVHLVTTDIERVEPKAVVTTDGRRHEVDVLVLGTGFDVTGSFAFLDITGRDGRRLEKDWALGMEAYLGTTVVGYPNLFTLVGPNTGLGHTSMLIMIEAQVDLVIETLKERDRRGARSVEVLPRVQREFNNQLQRRSSRSVWLTGCHSWYLDKSGVNRIIWPASTVAFRRQTSRYRPEDYRFEGTRA